MAKKGDPIDGKYDAQFRKHFEEIDELALAVLKSHLIMESAIDNIIGLIFFHPDLVLDARISFYVKVQMVRAYALHESEMTIWKLALAISELRNEIAHNLEGTKREKRLAAVRNLYLSEAPDYAEKHKNYPDHLIVILASSLCTGFLGEMEKDLTHLRKQSCGPECPEGQVRKTAQKELGNRTASQTQFSDGSNTAVVVMTPAPEHGWLCRQRDPLCCADARKRL